jgi:rhomboid family GlyGly-CTERM serine protease
VPRRGPASAFVRSATADKEAGLHQVARRTPRASLLLAATAVGVFLWPGLGAHLQYDRAAIAAGEVWRLFSGHWTHYSFDHACWDVLAFAALAISCERKSRSRFLACLVTSALAISLSVWLLLPRMWIYRGLSGIDSALFTLLIADMWEEHRHTGQGRSQVLAAVCLVGFLAKIAFELLTGRNVFVSGFDAGTVGVPLAHLVGAVCGLTVGFCSRFVLGSCHTQQWSSSTT